MYWWKVAVLKGPLELRRCFFVVFFLSGFSKSGLFCLFGASFVGYQKSLIWLPSRELTYPPKMAF